MKARHVIMIIALIIIATAMFSLKEAKNIKTLTCTTKSDFQGMDSVINLEIDIKNKEVQDMNLAIDVTIPKEYLNQKQSIIDSIAASGKMQVTSTKNGMRLKAGMNSNYFNSLGLDTNTSSNELKQVLESQGYTCKNEK